MTMEWRFKISFVVGLVAGLYISAGFCGRKEEVVGVLEEGVYKTPTGEDFVVGPGGVLLVSVKEEVQESTSFSYYRREGIGMSAWALIIAILGILGACSIAWFCYNVGRPMWEDRQRSRARDNVSASSHRLQETPSTATPSP